MTTQDNTQHTTRDETTLQGKTKTKQENTRVIRQVRTHQKLETKGLARKLILSCPNPNPNPNPNSE
jgi:hypothetical protein